MKIKHWQGYGCVNATKVKMKTKDGLRNLIIRVSGNHEYGLSRNDKYDVSNWLIKRFDKSFTNYLDIISMNIQESYDDLKHEDSYIYDITYRI